MKIRIHSTRALVVCLLLVLFAGCDDAEKQLAIAAKTNLEVQKFVIDAEKRGQMTVEETKVVVDATARIAKVGLAAVEVLEKVRKEDPASKAAALHVLGIVADEIGKLDLSAVGIKNEASRHNVQGLLAAMQASLNSARVIIAAKS